MLTNTWAPKGPVFGESVTRAILHVSCSDVKATHLVRTGFTPAFMNKILIPACLTTGQLSCGEFSSKGNDSAPRVELVVRLGLLVKRIMDVVLSMIVLVPLWPLMLIIAIAIKLESPGCVIYPSLRLGEKGRKFACYKFRTMVPGADGLRDNLRRLNQRHGPFFKIAADPRVTRFGRFLRKYSLDELPQFWNVLKGDMSLVGPRPHPVEDCAQYTFEHRRRLGVKPGVTGLWQVLARANPSFEICMILDLAYIEKWSLLLDCRILMKTIPSVLTGEGQ
jgi:lipopolysaccharide/colanic/teichoic acid biosynthesis glycosyltransferase